MSRTGAEEEMGKHGSCSIESQGVRNCGLDQSIDALGDRGSGS